jgi:hypothetical protein
VLESEPTLDYGQRRRILVSHYGVEPEEPGLPVYCGFCKDLWAPGWGCDTRRAIVLLGQTEARANLAQREAARRIEELSNLAMKAGARVTQHFVSEKDGGMITLTVQFNREMVLYGYTPWVDHTLAAVRRGFAKWWDDVGLQQRVDRDFATARMMDDAEYLRIRDFDPFAPVTYL